LPSKKATIGGSTNSKPPAAQSSSSSRVADGRAAKTLVAGTGIQTGAINARSRNETISNMRSTEATPGERGLAHESAFTSVIGWRLIALSPKAYPALQNDAAREVSPRAV
jgi:hypothetical protein